MLDLMERGSLPRPRRRVLQERRQERRDRTFVVHCKVEYLSQAVSCLLIFSIAKPPLRTTQNTVDYENCLRSSLTSNDCEAIWVAPAIHNIKKDTVSFDQKFRQIALLALPISNLISIYNSG